MFPDIPAYSFDRLCLTESYPFVRSAYQGEGLTTLLSLVKKVPALLAAATDSKTNVTLFAPTNKVTFAWSIKFQIRFDSIEPPIGSSACYPSVSTLGFFSGRDLMPSCPRL